MGFDIVAPLATKGERLSWARLGLMEGLGGGPTFMDTAVGRQFTSGVVKMVFMTPVAGSVQVVGAGFTRSCS
jgi:ZIP family zinc transporter